MLYDPRKPNEARLNSPLERYGDLLLPLIGPIGSLLVALLLYSKFHRPLLQRSPHKPPLDHRRRYI